MGIEFFANWVTDLTAVIPILEIFDVSSLSHQLLAQAVQDPDILGQIENAFKNFIESGQAWACAIGFFLGYVFRSFTSY